MRSTAEWARRSGVGGAGRARTVRARHAAVALAVFGGLAATGCGGGEGADAGDDTARATVAEAERTPNTLTPAEEAAGWRLLFDGESTAGWRGYGRSDMPDSWIVEDGTLTLRASSGNMDGGDIITEETFTDFELAFDFKVGPHGNSGVFYRVREVPGKGLWQVAAEYQVLDDPAYPATEDWAPATHRTAENYDLHASDDRPVRATGEWNSGRIVVEGNHVEHWLNGALVVAYDLYTEDWEARVAASKFATEEYYARAPSGSIGLQDHGTPVWYRNIRIRPLGDG